MRILLSALTNAFGDASRTLVSSTVVLIQPGESIVVGRDENCNFVLEQDPMVSRRHCEIGNDGRQGYVKDLGSSNGTYVNGNPVSTYYLGPGDQIGVGESFFKIGILDDDVASADPTKTSIAFVAVPTDDGDFIIEQESFPLQVALEIPKGDNKGLATETVSQLLPVIEAEDSRVFGRTSVGLDMVIRQDDQMSASHFEVKNDGVAAWLVDLESTNGTFLNGHRVRKARLNNDDLVLAGGTSFRVHLYGGSTPTEEEIAASIEEYQGDVVVSESVPKSSPYQAPRIVNSTGLQVAMLKGRIGFPRYSLTLIVKGTFDLHHGQVATLAEEQQFATGEVRVPNEEGVELLAYDSDFAFFKPRTDIAFVGSCYTPNGTPHLYCRSTLQVGRIEKSIDVYGDRFWESRLMDRASEPVPFVRMPLSMDRAFGGEKSQLNPVGKGMSKVVFPDGESRVPLPNLVPSGAQIQSSADKIAPTSFAPIDANWSTRSDMQGTFDQRWVQSRSQSHWFPEDLNWEYFNSAQKDLRADGYLVGDEEIRLTNLHPQYSQFVSRLPCLNVRSFVCASDTPQRSTHAAAQFREVDLRLDTVWIDGETQQLVVLWRGHFEVSHTFHPEIQHIYVHAEPTGKERSPAGYYWQPFLDALAAADGEFTEPDQAEAASSETQDNTDPSTTETWINPFSQLNVPSEAEQLDKLEKDSRVALIKAGIDPEKPPELSPAQQAAQDDLLKQWGLDSDSDEEPSEASDESEDAKLKREFVVESMKHGSSLVGADLSGADLSKLELSGLDFTLADLTGANLRKSKLAKCNLTQSVLISATMHGTEFDSCNLQDSDLASANLLQARFYNSDLSKAIVSNATLQQARFDTCVAEHAVFVESNLAQTEFETCRLKASMFDATKMSQTSFKNCDLARASLSAVTGIRCDFSGCYMPHAFFRQALLPGSAFREIIADDSVWTESEVPNSSFVGAKLNKSDMGAAKLDNCDFQYAELKSVRMAACSLRSAVLVRTNLFRARLEGANLTQADVSCSNLYGAELMDANFDQAKCEATNFKATMFYASS